MSMLDSKGDYETPCPKCGGIVYWWYFDSDCRGNDSCSGITCRKCGKEFTSDEWGGKS